jgi:hypothetical protein
MDIIKVLLDLPAAPLVTKSFKNLQFRRYLLHEKLDTFLNVLIYFKNHGKLSACDLYSKCIIINSHLEKS